MQEDRVVISLNFDSALLTADAVWSSPSDVHRFVSVTVACLCCCKTQAKYPMIPLSARKNYSIS